MCVCACNRHPACIQLALVDRLVPPRWGGRRWRGVVPLILTTEEHSAAIGEDVAGRAGASDSKTRGAPLLAGTAFKIQ